MPDEVWDAAAKVWSEKELADLVIAIATINVWNRIAVTTAGASGAGMTTEATDAAGALQAHRPMLLGLAYRLLGSRHDAEDVLQEAYLRWLGADRSVVEEPRRYLSRVVTRLALDRLRARQSAASVRRHLAARDRYRPPSPFGPLDRAELRDSLSTALLHVLERLSPPERAVYVLHTAFDLPYTEIAEILDRTAGGLPPAPPPGDQPGPSGAASLHRQPGRNGNGCWTRSSPPPATVTWRRSPAWSPRTPRPGTTAAVGSRAARNPVTGADRIARFYAGIYGPAPPDDDASGRTQRGTRRVDHPRGRQSVHADHRRGRRTDHRDLHGRQPGEGAGRRLTPIVGRRVRRTAPGWWASAQLGEPERDLALGAVRSSRRRAPGSPGWTATGRPGSCRRRPCGRRWRRPARGPRRSTWSPESTSATSGPLVMKSFSGG